MNFLRLFVFTGLFSMLASLAEERPNVVWIVSDDLSPELGCYGYVGIETPNIDRLAREGTRFTHAFSTSPVCSASRTAFQTGRYQIEIGGHHHDTRDKKPLVESARSITEEMQKAGYFVSNGHGIPNPGKRLAKSHFNWTYDAREFFDGNDWSLRGEGQPFFAQVQFKEPHRTFVQTDKEYPDSPIPPYYPAHPVTTADWANYLASIEVLDARVGDVLERLDEEGVTDNTLVLFFGDHGRPHVRDKQWLYDGGIRVPLIIRWPGQVQAGRVDERMVSLIDLVPTVLAAAGVESATKLSGMDLFDEKAEHREMIFAARDRCGDAPDRIRAVRSKDFKYLRNFHPEIPYMQHSGYKRAGYPVDTVMRVLHERGDWTSPFMAEKKSEEELYDLRSDPDEMSNVAADPAYADVLERMRNALNQWIEETGDRGAVDEGLTVDLEMVETEKWASFEKRMKSRGLSGETSDEDFLDWWETELGIE